MTNSKILKYAAAVTLSIMVSSINADAFTRHQVKKGETLWGVAYQYGLTADDIIKANPQASNGLKNGMVLRIPEKGDLDNLAAQDSQEQASEPAATAEQPQPIQAEPYTAPQYVNKDAQDATSDIQSSESAAATTETAGTVQPKYGDIDPTLIYIAKFGDTLHSVSSKTSVSETELLAYNPLIDIKHIPEGYPVRLTADAPHIAPSGSASLIDSIVYKVTPDGIADTVTKSSDAELVVAVMLPFDVDNETISRQSLLATDFYKGMLLAAKDALGLGKFPLKIIAVDTQCDDDKFDSQLDELLLSGVSVIIPPEDEAQLDKVEAAALDRGITVINALNVRDEGYLKYPNVVQCNINQKLMYDKAIQTLLEDYGDYTPVVLDPAGGKDEKLNFIEEMRRQYADAGIRVLDLPFKNALTASELATLPPNGKYIFIPKSGAVDIFNRFSDAIITLINENYADERYKVFGYPDWITFKGEQEDALHNMGATIYSRFYMDPIDVNTEQVNKDFIKWYGYQMEEVYPSQGMLGYDVGRMIFSKLKNTDRDMINQALSRGEYDGRQSSFKFRKADDSQSATPGLVNQTLYIIDFLPGTLTNARTK